MKVLVIGRSGQVARSLQDLASAYRELDIVAKGRPDVDLAIRGSAARLVTEVTPDVVVNAAAYTAVDQAEVEPERAFAINGIAAGELAEASRLAGAKIIQISTDYVYDGAAEGEYTEAAPANPLSVYGRSKLVGEEQVRSANPQHVILRTAWVYGPHGRNFLKTMIRLAQEKESISVVADQFGCPTSAADLAQGILTIVQSWKLGEEKGLSEVYHLAGSGSASWYEFASHIMREASRAGIASAEVLPIRTNEWPVAATRPRNTVLNCSKFSDQFGYEMPHWRSSVRSVMQDL